MSASQRILDFIDADSESVRVAADTDARAACKATLDASAVSLAGAQRTNAALTDQVTALTAALAAAEAGSATPPAPKVIEFKDFAVQSCGIYSPTKGLVGEGVAATTYRMKPMTSTKTAPTTPWSTNQNYLMHFGGLSASAIAAGIEVAGFTLQGTDQGHLYGGIRVGYSTGAKVHDLLITAIPGSSYSPPGETFSLSGWHANGWRVTNVKIDGRDAAGKPIAASLFATNSQDDVVFENIVGNYTNVAIGLTLWDSSNVTVRGADLRFNRCAVNCEQAHPGLMQFIDCDMRGQTEPNNPHMTVSGNKGSTKYVVTDPVVDKWPLRVGVRPTYDGVPSTQAVSDVRLIVGGKDVTSDPKYLMVGNIWGKSS